ncbi:MAG: hypothetical protein AB1898_31695 [Acidobacteriota bacterium]
MKGKKFDSSTYAFEVVDEDEVFTWCVTVKGSRMTGNRNRGHMSVLGIGSGARLFFVRAAKQETPTIKRQD